MILKTSAENGSSSSGCARSGRSVPGSSPCDRRDVERRRQVVDDGVEQRLHALVLEGRAAEDRDAIDWSMVARRSAPLSSSSVISSPARYFSSRRSSVSATASTSFSRSSCAAIEVLGGNVLELVLRAQRLVLVGDTPSCGRGR